MGAFGKLAIEEQTLVLQIARFLVLNEVAKIHQVPDREAALAAQRNDIARLVMAVPQAQKWLKPFADKAAQYDDAGLVVWLETHVEEGERLNVLLDREAGKHTEDYKKSADLLRFLQENNRINRGGRSRS
jgi:hypothetical protein